MSQAIAALSSEFLAAESSAYVIANPEQLFAYLDDAKRLSRHMSRSSWMMLGSSMAIDVDRSGGNEAITLSGRVLGLDLSVREVVTERQVPHNKVWQTIGTPNLLVIGPYRMGYEIKPVAAGSTLRVFIDYELPQGGFLAGLLGRTLGPVYARWCTRQMVNDAVRHFASK